MRIGWQMRRWTEGKVRGKRSGVRGQIAEVKIQFSVPGSQLSVKEFCEKVHFCNLTSYF